MVVILEPSWKLRYLIHLLSLVVFVDKSADFGCVRASANLLAGQLKDVPTFLFHVHIDKVRIAHSHPYELLERRWHGG